MNVVAVAKRVPGPARVGAAVWAVCVLLPALLTAARGSALAGGNRDLVKKLLGGDVAGYLGYAPDAFIAFVLGSLVICPLLLLLFALAHRESVGSPARRAGLTALRASAWWTTLTVVGLGLVFVVVAAARGHAGIQLGWSVRLMIRLTASGLPSLGLVTTVVMLFESRRRAFGIGLAAIVVVGYAGVIARVAEQGWLPARIDQALLSGRPGWPAVIASASWLTVGLLAVAILEIRQRRIASR